MNRMASYLLNLSRRFQLLLLCVVVGLIGFCGLLITPRSDFPTGRILTVPKGTTVRETATFLYQNKVIRFPALFVLLDRAGIQAGGYLLDRPQNVFSIAARFRNGEFRLPQISIVFPEGITIKEMARRCAAALTLCDQKTFEELAKTKEGYLFPDTYYFLGDAKASDVIDRLETHFTEKIQPLETEIARSGKSKSQIITMASIIEEEANTSESRKIVSGILWKRLAAGMPLQADATLGYVTGKGSHDLTVSDLASPSPYNTYTHTGLPPTPISNPGLSAIDAALHPQASPYWYYLTDRSGTFYYARTFEEHKQNKARYLQ
jgi:UPF0755 protein